jgi:hypothetical protein
MQVESVKDLIINILLSYAEKYEINGELIHVIEQSEIGLIANDLIKELSLDNDN